MLGTFVTKIENKTITYINQNETKTLNAKAIILASGCRERTAGAISLPGNRVSGVYTAGFVQKMVNHLGFLPGKTAVILGSGDIGLIMARRLTFEGVKVKGIYEIMKTSSGLARNIKQCAIDYNIPIKYSTTIVEVVGKDRVSGIFYAKVDENLKPMESTKKFVKCDCVLLSVGLIPEIDLIAEKLEINPKTNSAYVDEYRQTNIEGLFISGNCLHIHDLADNASLEGEIAGKSAALYSLSKLGTSIKHKITAGENISYVLPNFYNESKSDFKINFRAKSKLKLCKLSVLVNGIAIKENFINGVLPGEMQEIDINKSNLNGDITLNLIEVKK